MLRSKICVSASVSQYHDTIYGDKFGTSFNHAPPSDQAPLGKSLRGYKHPCGYTQNSPTMGFCGSRFSAGFIYKDHQLCASKIGKDIFYYTWHSGRRDAYTRVSHVRAL